MGKVYILMCGEAYEGGNIEAVNNTWEKAVVSAHKYIEDSRPKDWIEESLGVWKVGFSFFSRGRDRLWIEEHDVDNEE